MFPICLILAHAICVDADNKWSFDQLLQTPLPSHQAANTSRSTRQRDKDHHTHPASVQHWDIWEADVKNRLQEADILVSTLSIFCLLVNSNCLVHKLLAVFAPSRMRVLCVHEPMRLLAAGFEGARTKVQHYWAAQLCLRG